MNNYFFRKKTFPTIKNKFAKYKANIYICTNKNSIKMATLSLNAELLRQASYLTDDDFYLERAVKFLKNLVKEKKSKAKDETLMTKEEFFAEVDEALEQAKRGEVTRFTNKEDMVKWLNSL